MKTKESRAITNCVEYTCTTPFPALSQKIRQINFNNHLQDLQTMEVVWEKNFLYENIWTRGITLDPLVRASRTCHAYLFFIGIMWCKFQFDDLKTVGGVWDTSFHQQTDCPMTQVNSPLFSSVGNKKMLI